MSLRDWLRNAWLVEHDADPAEIRELLSLADRDLRDCGARGLSPDWRLHIAYNAALQSATAALAAAGYRAARESHHLRVIHSLAFTIAARADVVTGFDRFRKKRNISGYERAGTVSDHEPDEMVELARRLRKDVEEWLRTEHPERLNPDTGSA